MRVNYGYTKAVDSTEVDSKPNLITLTSYVIYIQHSRYMLLKIVKEMKIFFFNFLHIYIYIYIEF